MDERLIERLKTLLGPLQKPVALLDEWGTDLLGQEAPGLALPEGLMPDVPVRQEGRSYLGSNAVRGCVWSAEGDSGDTLLLAEALLMTLVSGEPANGSGSAYRRILTEDLDPWELEELVGAYGIESRLSRCVLVVESDVHWRGELAETLRQLLPAGPSDVLVPIDRHTAACLVDMNGMDGRDELMEYANAVQDSLLSEAGCAALIGVGGCSSDVIGLHTSYNEARRAIGLGRIFEPKRTVLDHERMLLPRFLAEIPAELAQRYHGILFNADTAKVLSDELLETVSMFFEKDLNLSDTARQLYIHRNTLTYRLDKIARLTGLDLRRFDDAVTFKIMMEMKKITRDQQGVIS